MVHGGGGFFYDTLWGCCGKSSSGYGISGFTAAFQRFKRYCIKLAVSSFIIGPVFTHPVAASSQKKPAHPDEVKPNVLLVAMDDVGYADLGCYGGEIRTINIDSLARDGIRHIRFDTNAVCSATRASLPTGRNSQTVKIGFLAAIDTNQMRMAAEAKPNRMQ